MAEREAQIIDLMGKGLSCAEICRVLAPKYRVSERTIERQYYIVVNQAVQNLSDEKKKEYRAEAIARADYAYKRAVSEGNIKYALDATNLKAKITGLYEKSESNETSPTVINIQEQDFSKPLEVVKEGNGSGDD